MITPQEAKDLKNLEERLVQCKLDEQNAKFATQQAQYSLDQFLHSLTDFKSK